MIIIWTILLRCWFFVREFCVHKMRIVVTFKELEFQCSNFYVYIWGKCPVCNCRILLSNFRDIIQQHGINCKGAFYAQLSESDKLTTLVA